MPLTFTVEVDADYGGTPQIAVEPPPADDYVGDDDTDLVSYPTPTLIEYGRPDPGEGV